jgi:hypothetical protein
MAQEMTSQNSYAYGQAYETVGYVASGTMVDWSYGDEVVKDKVWAFTTEIGGSGFWPTEGERDGLIQENLYSNLYLTLVAGAAVELTDLSVVGGDGNGRLDAGESAQLVTTLENFGIFVAVDDVEATLSCSSPYVQITDAVSFFGHMDPGEISDSSGDPFAVTVDALAPDGVSATFRVRITADPGLDLVKDVELLIGELPAVYLTEYEGGGGGWETDPSHNAQSGAFVRIDPNGTEYQPEDDTTADPGVYAWVTGQNTSVGEEDVDNGIAATRSPIWDLAGLDEAVLRLNYFFGQRDWGDDAGDFFRIDLSNNGGASYPVNLLSFGDETHASIWTSLEVDLGSTIALTDQMRIRVQAADGVATGDIIEAGIDDVFVLEGNANEPPSAPALSSPADGEDNQPAQPALAVFNSIDPESDPLTYGFRVYGDLLLTDLVASVDGVAEGGGGTTSWVVDTPLSEGEYWWRAYAEDAYERGPFMDAARFIVGESSSAPETGAGLAGLDLGRPTPNPVHTGTRIPFYAPRAAHLDASVVDVSGRRVVSLRRGPVEPGWGYLAWDGTDGSGGRAASGFYWVRVRLGEEEETTRLLVVK